MRKRSVEILIALLQSGNKVFTISGLAETYGVSERTLRNDLQMINDFLDQAGLCAIAIGNNGALRFSGEIDRDAVMEQLTEADAYSYHMHQRERDDIILAVLLTSEGHITTDELANILSVSRPTVVKDINHLRGTYFQGELKLQSMPGIGLKLEYNERIYRKELLRIVTENFTTISKSLGAFQSILLKTLNFDITLETIARLVRKSEQRFHLQFADSGYVQLSCYLFVAANRIFRGYHIEEAAGRGAFGDGDGLPDIFQDVMNQLGLPSTDAELDLLWEISRKWQLMAPKQYNENYIALENHTAKFIDNLSQSLQVDLLRDDSLFDFMIYYIDDLLQRYMKGQTKENPLTQQVRENYPQTYAVVAKEAGLFADGLGIQLEADDLAYLTMHVVAAIERLSQFDNVLQVLLVCPGSMATGQFLVSQVRKHFSFRIKDVCSVRNLYDAGTLDDVNFIISTTPAWNDRCPFVVVNPLLQLEDIKHIQEVAFQVMNAKKEKFSRCSTSPNILQRLRQILVQQNDPVIRGQIYGELEKVISRFSQKEEKKKHLLSELIAPELIELTDRCGDWREALWKAGTPLVAQEKISNRYIVSTIHNCEYNGPYFVLSDGLAIAHTHPEDGLMESAVGLLFVREGVSFQHKSYGPVRLLFFVCLKEPNNHVLKLLMDCAKDAEFVKRLEQEKTGRGVYELLCAYERGDGNWR